MSQLRTDKVQPENKPESAEKKSLFSASGQQSEPEELRSIGRILQLGGSFQDMSARQLQLLGKTAGNTLLLRMLSISGERRGMQRSDDVWDPNNLLAEQNVIENDVTAGPSEYSQTPRFSAVEVASMACSDPFAGGYDGIAL